jgi:hypothetical protein
MPSTNSVTIRMYGQGVGDCFLLSFPRTGAAEERAHVLIDCGVIGGMPDGPKRMKAVVNDIKQVTAGELDLLVLTHEHWDHASGFVQASEEWQQIKVHTLWTAWTESDDQSGLPGVLKRILDQQRRTLAQLADHALRYGLTDQLDTAVRMMGFLSDGGSEGLAFGAAPGIGDAFEAAKARAEQHVCCEPGDVRPVRGTDAIAYVLGPPRDEARLRQMDPSTRTPQTYGNQLQAMVNARSSFNAFVSTILSNAETAVDDPDVQVWRERSAPFQSFLRVPLASTEVQVARQPETFSGLDAYFDELNDWRRIDNDWLTPAETFALQADHLTNNTSLVLAFELPASDGGDNKVLLFTGDAQVGNWLSWYDIKEWRAVDGARPRQAKPDIVELLGRVAFYKVGHHGSHNATLSTQGVERMPRGEHLMAFVPVSKQVASQLKKWSKMPLEGLLNALSERAPGRVVLPNTSLWPARDPSDAAQLQAIEVRQSADTLPVVVSRDGTRVEDEVPLWVEVTLTC